MSYGELKIDTITFTAGGVDTSVSVSGLVQNPTFTGNITTTGTISGDVIRGNTISGVTITGDTGNFTSGIFSTGTAAAPSIVFDGDPDTGFFSALISGTTSQHVSYAISGAEALRLTRQVGDNRIQFNNFTSRVSEQVLIEDTGSTLVTVVGNNANGAEEGGAYLTLARTGAGSLNSYTALLSGNVMGKVQFRAANGVGNIFVGASIEARADRNTGSTSTPGNLAFFTTPSGSTTPVERIHIESSGNVGVGTSIPSGNLHVSSSSSTAYDSTNMLSTTSLFRASNTNTTSGIAAGITFETTGDGAQEAQAAIRCVHTGNGAAALALGTRRGGTNSTSEALRIDSSGRLLISTTSVQQVASADPQINVVGTNYSTSAYGAVRYESAGSGASVLLGHSRGTQASPEFLVTDDELGKISFCAHAGASAPNGIGAVVQAIADDNHASSDFPSRLVFQTCPDSTGVTTPRMTIKANGRVGIGTTDPQRLCEISLTQNNPTGGFNASSNLVLSNAGTASNNVGMSFSAGSSGACFIHFGDQNDADVGSLNYANGTNAISLETGSVERWRLDSSGRVRHIPYGLTAPSSGEFEVPYFLGVSGQSTITDNPGAATPAFLRIMDLGANNNYYHGIELRNKNSGDLRLLNGDSALSNRSNFYIAMDTDINSIETVLQISYLAAFYATGVYDHTTASSANVNVISGGQLRRSTSSSKYKTDIETLEDSYADALLNCRPVWYRSTCMEDNPDWSHWGLIAEEVAAIDPRLVHWSHENIEYTDRLDEDGTVLYEEDGVTPQRIRVKTKTDELHPEGVAYERFVPHLLNLIKRQKEQIEALDARLSALETV